MRLLIIDDHALFREGLVVLIGRDNPDAKILEAGSLLEAQEIVESGKHKLDFVLLDLKLPEMEASEVAALAIPLFPDTPVVVLSGEPDPRLMRGAIEAGAMGFIPKTLSFFDFSGALSRSLSGEVYLPQLSITEGLNALRRGRTSSGADAHSVDAAVARLSPRQLEILRLLVYGFSNKSIAKQLKLSDGTVKTHMGRIFPILGVHSRAEAVYLLAQVEQSIGIKNTNTRMPVSFNHDD
jgi:DNA-binding NarL/FixJ family response regulator